MWGGDLALENSLMSVSVRVEAALEALLGEAQSNATPPLLASAVRYCVFPGGARVRPSLCLAVAEACGDEAPGLADAAAAAVEFLHCASLVHDDLPCFDDADSRRGKPSVHRIYGEPLAVLTGDALIVLAFDVLGSAAATRPERLAPLIRTLAQGVGMPSGIVAGQAWESEPVIDVAKYHQSKTGALFVAATRMGAIAAGASPAPWSLLGEKLGAAYQAADDLMDAVSSEGEGDKPIGQDARLHRPNLVAELGVQGALHRLQDLVGEAVAAIPDCEGAQGLRDMVRAQAMRLTPKHLARSAA